MLCFPSRTGGPTHGFPFFSQENAGKPPKYVASYMSTPKGDSTEEVREREKKRRGGIDLVFTDLTPPSFSPPLPSFHRTPPPRGPTLGSRTPTGRRCVCEREREKTRRGGIDPVFPAQPLPPSCSLFSQDATASGSGSADSDSDGTKVCVREREREREGVGSILFSPY